MLSAQTATSRARLRRNTRHREIGASHAGTSTAAAGSRHLRLTTGAATPAATRAMAAARMALDALKARPVYVCRSVNRRQRQPDRGV